MLSKARLQLIWELARRELSERYVGNAFGLLWTSIHPATMLLVYLFVFGYVFKSRIPADLHVEGSFTLYFLSGFVCWVALSEAISKGSTIILQNRTLVQQIVFPLEVLPLKTAVATMFTHFIFVLLVLAYLYFEKSTVSYMLPLIVVLFFLTFLLVSGICFTLSVCGVFFRDTADMVQVFLVIGIFSVPVLYLPGFLQGPLGKIVRVNPFSYAVYCYQDVLFFGRFEHPLAWFVYPVTAITVFLAGRTMFQHLKHTFGDAL
jgi:lipopolysaccharide transport system permease protein